MANKVVVLNSGGFDSIVLINYVHSIMEWEEPVEIHSMHFLYGAPNEKQQLRCVNKVCEKLNIKNVTIELPKLDWTKNNFYGDGYEFESQYLEWRNLIFLSYALSYAESIGAHTIFIAYLASHSYNDTSYEFLEGFNLFSAKSGIGVRAPFRMDYKGRLMHIARYLGITEDDYFTCDTPTEDGKPCGECDDCKYLKELSENIW